MQEIIMEMKFGLTRSKKRKPMEEQPFYFMLMDDEDPEKKKYTHYHFTVTNNPKDLVFHFNAEFTDDSDELHYQKYNDAQVYIVKMGQKTTDLIWRGGWDRKDKTVAKKAAAELAKLPKLHGHVPERFLWCECCRVVHPTHQYRKCPICNNEMRDHTGYKIPSAIDPE